MKGKLGSQKLKVNRVDNKMVSKRLKDPDDRLVSCFKGSQV